MRQKSIGGRRERKRGGGGTRRREVTNVKREVLNGEDTYDQVGGDEER